MRVGEEFVAVSREKQVSWNREPEIDWVSFQDARLLTQEERRRRGDIGLICIYVRNVVLRVR